MAKKKATKVTEQPAKSLKEALGIDNILNKQRDNLVLGFCLILV